MREYGKKAMRAKMWMKSKKEIWQEWNEINEIWHSCRGKNEKQNVIIFYKKWKKSNEIQLTKNKMDLNIRKMTNHPPSPDIIHNK